MTYDLRHLFPGIDNITWLFWKKKPKLLSCDRPPFAMIYLLFVMIYPPPSILLETNNLGKSYDLPFWRGHRCDLPPLWCFMSIPPNPFSYDLHPLFSLQNSNFGQVITKTFFGGEVYHNGQDITITLSRPHVAQMLEWVRRIRAEPFRDHYLIVITTPPKILEDSGTIWFCLSCWFRSLSGILGSPLLSLLSSRLVL